MHIVLFEVLTAVWSLNSFHAGILLSLFDPEDGADVLLGNVGWLSRECAALYPRISESELLRN
jgi:hypothetical protein